MRKLYEAVFDDDEKRKELYFKNSGAVSLEENSLVLKQKGAGADLLTYFNSFSIAKWKKYTTIKYLSVDINIEGRAKAEIYAVSRNKERILYKNTVCASFSKTFSTDEIKEEIIGVRLTAEEKHCALKKLSYSGEFAQWKEPKIGAAVCTYKREKYVKKTIDKLKNFSEKHPYLSILVIDNGRTLQETETDKLRIIHNPNYGGSGGFARGMIENLNENKNDYVLLMDDDIDIDASVIEKTHALLSGLKKEYKDSFLSGAMLNMDEPQIQYENTAYWKYVRLRALGKNFDLSQKEYLLKNDFPRHKNHYAAWWYCCIPLKRIKEIGLPLPLFVKGDDMEYSIRNNREILTLNGIGVWHEPFRKKQSPAVNYHSDRNMLIMNHYAQGCGRLTFLIACTGRIIKRLINKDEQGIKLLNLALKDIEGGFEKITDIPADKKLTQIQNYSEERNILSTAVSALRKSLYSFIFYKKQKEKYVRFRNKMTGSGFWLNYFAKSKV